MTKISVTSGEQLFDSVLGNVNDFHAFDDSAPRLFNATRRSHHLTGFFQSLLALSVTARLIRYGRYLIEEYPELEDAYLRTKIVEFARDKLLIYSGNCSDLDEIVARALEASRKSKRKISKAIKAQIQSDFPEPKCYLCGIALEYGIPADSHCETCGHEVHGKDIVTFEHLWPSTYGGDTDARNLLPACYWCNRKKGALTSWQWANISATLLANQPSDEDWKNLGRDAKIAVAMRVTWDVAIRDRLSLREAALKAGPYNKEFSLVEPDDSSDFFNIRAHDLEALGLDWSLR